ARKSEWLAVILFYVIFTSLFPIALGTWSHDSARFAPVIIWVGALIATLLAQETLLRTDFKSGAFDAMLLSSHPFSLLLGTKIMTHWFVYALPIVLLTPLVAMGFALSLLSTALITFSLFIGTIFISLMAAIGASITVPLARGGVFLAMLILPLFVPVLCIGSEIGILSLDNIVSTGHIALLLALVIIAMLCVPIAVATAVKVSNA
ncbi:MAG TPA: heme exporter protein CcmB, partial [Gammaproteobacteria bacterium]|nr:heme exporter protein CcmB [Gammaproteobacteria bacterium]